MYYYILHNELNKERYNKTLVDLHSLTNNLGLSGKFYQLSPYSELQNIINKINITSNDTVCVVGDDSLLTNTINLILKSNLEPIICYLPIVNNNNILPKLFDIPKNIEKSVLTLSKRKIKLLTIAKLDNDYFFINNISFNPTGFDLLIDNKYNIEYNSENLEKIFILNSTHPDFDIYVENKKYFNILFLYSQKEILTKKIKIDSILKAQKISISTTTNQQQKLTIDNSLQINTPVSIEKGKEIKVIVGKNPIF